MRLSSNFRRSGFTQLGRAFTSTDGAIDAVVYELYGLTEEEVRIVEGK